MNGPVAVPWRLADLTLAKLGIRWIGFQVSISSLNNLTVRASQNRRKDKIVKYHLSSLCVGRADTTFYCVVASGA